MAFDLNAIRRLESERIALVDDLATIVHGTVVPGKDPLSEDEKQARIKKLTNALTAINDRIWIIRGTP